MAGELASVTLDSVSDDDLQALVEYFLTPDRPLLSQAEDKIQTVIGCIDSYKLVSARSSKRVITNDLLQQKTQEKQVQLLGVLEKAAQIDYRVQLIHQVLWTFDVSLAADGLPV